MATGFVIYASYGEYDDYTEIPLFFVPTRMEMELFLDSLEKKEQPYWQKVVEHWIKRYPTLVNALGEEDFVTLYMPSDLGFGFKEVEVLTLMEQHPAT